MTNATRNFTMLVVAHVACIACLGGFAYVIYAMEPFRLRGIVLLVIFAVVSIGILAKTLIEERMLSRLRRDIQADGFVLPDEERLPIRFAESRDSLVSSIVALVLIALAFVAYYAGWFEAIGL